jgi:hypothetical protein
MNHTKSIYRPAFWIGILAVVIFLGLWLFCDRMGIDISLGDLARNALILLGAVVALCAAGRK